MALAGSVVSDAELAAIRRSSEKSQAQPGTTQCKSGKKHCPSNPVTSNGCGTSGWKGKLVPEKPFWMIDFTEPCNTHDVCYGTCGNGKKKCDEDFRDDMYVACYMRFGWNSTKPIPKDLEAKLVACVGLAKTYYEAVSKAGNSAYSTGQEEGCRCCCEEKKK